MRTGLEGKPWDWVNRVEVAQRLSIASPRTKTDLVYEALRKAMMAGRYPPGSRIVADQLAQELGISKVPVREAIVRLAGDGWLQLKPHVGAVVPELSLEDILETAALRAALEGMATRLAAERISTQQLALLRVLLDRHESESAQGAYEYMRLNLEFHSAAFAACPYPSLRTMAASLIEKSTFRWAPVRMLPNVLQETNQQHRILFDAMEHHDAEAAERIVRQHVERAGRALWAFVVEQFGRSPGKDLQPVSLCSPHPETASQIQQVAGRERLD